jgi:hypothetical protein
MKKIRQYFELLGVTPGATLEEIEAAHRNSIRLLDPDRLSNDAFQRQRALARLWEINEAYSMIQAVLKAHLPLDAEGAEKEPALPGGAGEGADSTVSVPVAQIAGPTATTAAVVASAASDETAPHASTIAGSQKPLPLPILSQRGIACVALAFLFGLLTGILIDKAAGPPTAGNTVGPERTIKQSAEQGDPRAQAILGAMYYNGKVVGRDYRQALNWYRKAAVQGVAEAQYNLGFMYYMGKGVEPDREEALIWFRRAAEQGDAKARDALQRVVANGR